MFGKVELTQLCELQRENNALLRELLVALGRNPTTAKVSGLSPRTFTDKDVTIVSRTDRLKQQLERGSADSSPVEDPRLWPGFRDDIDAQWIEVRRGKPGRQPGLVPSDTGRAAADRGDVTYPKAVSTREQSPAHRARVALKDVREAHAEELSLRRHDHRLRESLVSGATNGTVNQHVLANVFRFTKGGRQTFLAHIQRAMRNGDPDARAWWLIYGDLLPAQQARVDLDDVCEAAGVPPDRLLAIAVSSATRAGVDMADYVAAVMHPKIVHQTAKSAMRIGGEHAAIAQKDREFMLQHAKFLPSKVPGTNVTVNATAQAAAHAAAASQPSVPTFAESLQGSVDAQHEVQRQIADTVVDGDLVEAP